MGAALGLTAMKLLVEILTGSLGILAEAAHSGLDLIAALMTLFAVRVSSRPADETHHYGHEKFENLSAFLEALLLLATAGWVIVEAIRRLLTHEGNVEISLWAFLVMGVSILVDVTRSRVLLRVARKVGSQALEADALHFSTDIWSSTMVIAGLLVVFLTGLWHLPSWLTQADAPPNIADLLQHGLLKASFIPSGPQRELRDLTRYRVRLTEEKARGLCCKNDEENKMSRECLPLFCLGNLCKEPGNQGNQTFHISFVSPL
ncbi:cation diffusion facilitator family transporter [Ktedonobacter robiniae]|uniref:Cation efflux protein transmembrane domain-containing protein n=1 Tax=Ktedonobacter robiniae TaxID=2778365 RepID=A0ABQ3V693_9CHLR|nr:hypothetical protein KSB_89380 [Ktedonobacter robiniae]